MKDKVIGVIGGMGPYAGLELVRHIFDQTIAASDQEHLPVVLFSMGDRVPDRSTFLFGKRPRTRPTPLPSRSGWPSRSGPSSSESPATRHTPRRFSM